jgi:hypothetical protein
VLGLGGGGALQIGQHLKYGVLQKDEFKIVYVAPMKVPSSSPPFAPYSNCILRGLTDDLIRRLQSQLTNKNIPVWCSISASNVISITNVFMLVVCIGYMKLC